MAKKTTTTNTRQKTKTKTATKAKSTKAKPKRKPAKPSKPKPSPIHHVHLPDELLKQIAAIYKSLGPYLGTTLEQFEIGFLQDMHPVREIALWIKIEAAWRSYHAKFLPDRSPSKEEEKKLVSAFIAIATGITDSVTLGVSPDVARKLLDCFAHASDRDSKPTKKRGR
jgi:hypothetical protein